LSKHLTAGEGGICTTNDPALAQKLDALRNCGRRPERDMGHEIDKGAGQYGDDGNFIQSGNYRITEFQAAILVEGLKRLPEQNKVRDENGKYINELLETLPGVRPIPRDPRETRKAYFNFAFSYDKEGFKGLPVNRFRDALGAELGIEVDACYSPLNQCSLYVPLTKPSRHKLNKDYWKSIDPSRFELPVCDKVYHQTSVCFHHKVLLGTSRDMDMIINAIRKIYQHAEHL
jgi:L-glutamine:2-deoxy-scyllo-inosose/3-amino-2,3-dideoxy-scyllo-inosose aminotransferase